MKIRIVNIKKLVRSILVILGILILLSLVISNSTLSHGNQIYKTIHVSNGDTLWKIARIEQESNEYYQNKDIRAIIDNIKENNNLIDSELVAGQELSIPII